MTIRTAKNSDYKSLMELYNEFVGEKRYSKYNQDSFDKVLNNKNNFIYVVDDKKKLIGFAAFSVRLVIRYPKPIAELDELYVLPKYRRKGIGQKLMKKILSKAKELNCYSLFIESHYDHKSAHKFYEKMNFINYGYHFIKNLSTNHACDNCSDILIQ